MAESFLNLWVSKKAEIFPLSTQLVDSIELARFSSLELVVSISSQIDNKVKGFKASISQTETGLKHSVFSRIGDPISIEFSVTATLSNCEISIKNDEAFSLSVHVARLKLN